MIPTGWMEKSRQRDSSGSQDRNRISKKKKKLSAESSSSGGTDSSINAESPSKRKDNDVRPMNISD